MSQQNIRAAMLLCAMLGGHAGAAFAERADRDKPIRMEADQVSIDDARQVSIFMGKVRMTQGTLSINGDQVVVTQGSQGFEHGTVTGRPAGFRQKREGSDEYVEGYGTRIEYDAAAGIMEIYGEVHIKRGQDDMRGEHITYDLRTEIFRGSGDQAHDGKRFTATISPPKAASAVAPSEPLPTHLDTKLINPEKKP